MKTAIFFAAFPILAVFAAVDPLEPAPGDVYKPGATCSISWDKDTTGTWTTMNIELMSGSNEDMTHLTTIATLDGTTKTSYSWTCPEVTPNAAIYFYQFSSPADTDNTTWTGRFAISDDSGATTDPAETTDGVAWGSGSLVDSSDASAEPTYLDDATASGAAASSTSSGSKNSTATSTASTGKTSSSVRGALTSTGSLSTTLVTKASAASTSSATPSSVDESASSGAASFVAGLQSFGLQALMGLTSTAIVFSTIL